MMTKRTGRPSARPKKALAEPSPKGKVGRPPLPFASDPERWGLADIERAVQFGARHGRREQDILLTCVALKFGRFLWTRENVARLALGLPIRVWIAPALSRLPPWREKQSLSDECENPRLRDGFQPIVAVLRAQLNLARRRDGKRLQTMVNVLICCQQGEVAQAQRLAASISDTRFRGETAFALFSRA
jgi:hypothetical protein